MIENLKSFLEDHYLSDIAKLVDKSPDQQILTIDFVDIDWDNLALAEYLLENPENLMADTKQALKMMDLPAGISVYDIKIQYDNLPQPDFNMFCSE
ncbi:MAG: hypothetical protein Q7J10_02740 [Methanosarcinaceae archaeon]|nr:hypothetical protein [Methanosarcinaceae archaeon]